MYSIPFRSLEEIARITAVCCTSMFRRIKKIVPTISDSHGIPVYCAIESTGFNITIRGDYLEQNGRN